MSGGVVATCVCPTARPQMATVRPGVFDPIKVFPKATRRRLDIDLRTSDLDVEVVERRTRPSDVGIGEAEVIVAGGAGCSQANWYLVEELAEAVGGSVAASRGAVEAGLAPRKLQVGQTGTTVQPRLYVACGISGALQHVVGMQRAETIVAVNRDSEAPIFRFAHFGIIGDVADVLPTFSGVLRDRSRDRWPLSARRS